MIKIMNSDVSQDGINVIKMRERTMKNIAILLNKRPDPAINEETFTFETREARELRDGDIQVSIDYVSIDPAMRSWIDPAPSYVPPVELGAVMRAATVGTVNKSRHPDFQVGETVEGFLGAQSVYSGPGKLATKIDTQGVDAKDYLGGMGGTGLAAYFGLLKVGELKPGDQVLISAAAGAVGHVAVQIAKLKGAFVVGLAGGAKKCNTVIDTYGADDCIDYKSDDVALRISELFPNGVDVYFDNVGGPILEAALDNLAMGARVVVCGAIGEYDNLDSVRAPKNYLNLIGAGAKMQGVLNMHWVKQYPAARAELSEWRSEGKLHFTTQVETGLESFPRTLSMLFNGGNTGKLILQV